MCAHSQKAKSPSSSLFLVIIFFSLLLQILQYAIADHELSFWSLSNHIQSRCVFVSSILDDPERVMKRVHVEQHSASYSFDVSFSNVFLPFLPCPPCSFSQIVPGNLHSYSIKATCLFHFCFCETQSLMSKDSAKQSALH